MNIRKNYKFFPVTSSLNINSMAYGTQRFNAAIHKGSPIFAILCPINAILSLIPISLRYIIIVFFHMRLGLPKVSFL